MLRHLSILNTETNKLVTINTTQIAYKLLSTVSSKGKPTWKITYTDNYEDEEDLEYTGKKGFGAVKIQKGKKISSSQIYSNNTKNNNSSLNKTEIELNKNKNVSKQVKRKEKQITKFNNPEFEIIKSTNSESVLFAKMDPNSLFYAKYGTVVGLSSKVKIELSYEDNTDEVLKGGNGSGIFAFEKVWTESKPGQVLLVPVKGDLMLISVKANKEYIVKGKALFSADSTISVNDYYHNNHQFEGVKYFIIKGKGSIAIEGEGGVLEITLNEDEHFLVKPSTLLAFESQMTVKPVLSSTCTEEIEEDVLENQSNEDKSSFWKKAKGMIDRAKVYISGDQLFYRLRGPGKFYISTRIPSMSGFQSFKLNNKDKKINNKTIQKRNYSTNSRLQIPDDYEIELENEISTLQKKLMEKTLNKQINKKSNSKKGKKRITSTSKKQSNDRYPNFSNQKDQENDVLIEDNEILYQPIIDEKAVLYKKSDKVKSPKSAMFFTSRESTEETNIDRSLIKTPKKNSIDVYLDEDVGEALIRENKKYKNNKFSLSSHQNQNLKTIINAEVKENNDRSINSKLEKRTAEIKAESKRKRQQELNPKRNFNVDENKKEDDDNEIDENEYEEDDVIDDNEEDNENQTNEFDENEDENDIIEDKNIENGNIENEEVEDEEIEDKVIEDENVEDEEIEDEIIEDENIEDEEVEDEEIEIEDEEIENEIIEDENVDEEVEDEVIENEEMEDEDIEEVKERKKEKVKPKKVIQTNKRKQNNIKKNKQVIKIKNEPEQKEKKVWTMKENIKDNKFFTFDDKNPLSMSSTTSKANNTTSNDSSFKDSLKKKSTSKKVIKKASNLSKQSNTRKNLSSKFKNNSKKRPLIKSKKQNQAKKNMNRAIPVISRKSRPSTTTRKPIQKIYDNKINRYNENEDDYVEDNEIYDNEEIEDDNDRYIEDEEEIVDDGEEIDEEDIDNDE